MARFPREIFYGHLSIEKGGRSHDRINNQSTTRRNWTRGDRLHELKSIPRSDPPLLVLARTRFILEHGESILPPYHILNSNSECIAVWCKTGRWSTFQASVFLHSSAIGCGKSAIGLTIVAAATQPWLIPAFATVGVAAVGTPWLLLKVANEKMERGNKKLDRKVLDAGRS
jgi:hypothetical protein